MKQCCFSCLKKIYPDKVQGFENRVTDQIGWFVPAVPDEHGHYWGYIHKRSTRRSKLVEKFTTMNLLFHFVVKINQPIISCFAQTIKSCTNCVFSVMVVQKINKMIVS